MFVAGLAAWALVGAGDDLVALPLMAILPLLLLAATFEAVFALHVGVERIGRYLQVFYDDRWEQTAMAFGPPLAGTGTDPLFAVFFGLATMCNFVPVMLAEPVRVELAVVGGVHVLFVVRLVVARHAAGRQRAADLARFRRSKTDRINAANRESAESVVHLRVLRLRDLPATFERGQSSAAARAAVPRQESVVSNDSLGVCAPAPLPPPPICTDGIRRLVG